MGIPIIAQLTRQGGANFPIAVGEDVKGAFVVVADVTARDAIPTSILRTGAVVRIGSSSTYYEWNGSAWVTFSGFGGGGSAIDWKDSVRFATTTALAASTRVSNTRTASANGAFPTVDGVTAAVGNRFLDKDNATGADRGIWEITSLGSGGAPWVIARASDADTSAEVTAGMGFVVAEGTANGGKIFLLATADPITLNTTSLTFTALTVSLTGLVKADGTVPLSATWALGNQALAGVKSVTYNSEVAVAAAAIDWTAGQLAKKLSLAANTTFTWTDPAGPCFVTLHVSQDGTGGRTVTLPTVTWLDGVAWQPNPAANSHSLLTLFTDGAGNYYGYGRALDSYVVTESSTARTFALTDAGIYLRTTNAAAVTLTVPPNSSVAFPINTLITGIQAAAGQITLAQGAGVTINKPTSRNRKTAEQYSTWALKKVGTDEWDLFGDLEFA